MRRSLWWFLVAVVLLAVVGAGVAVAQVGSTQAKSTPVPTVKPLTAEAARVQPVDFSKPPRLIAKLAVPNTPSEWNGPDLQPRPSLLIMQGPAAGAGCTDFPYPGGWTIPWNVINVGKAPAPGPIKLHLTCEVVNPTPAPGESPQELDRKLCGCQRKDVIWNMPSLPPNKETFPSPQAKSVFFYQVIVPCNSPLPHPRVTAKVDPAAEGPATGNNTQVYEMCN